MRLICPNCDAQYEVPKEVMPPEGRDVQCSNCGQTWFQEHPDHPIEKPQDTASERPENEEDTSETADQPEDFAEEEVTDPELDVTDEEASDDDEPVLPERRELDPAVADVLRAEAELEAEARRRDAAAVESQPDLGLTEGSSEAGRESDAEQERKPKPRDVYLDEDDDGQEELLEATETSALASRRELLPDIEEINSTLRSNNDRPASADPGQTAQVEAQEKRSSRLGFSLSVGVFALLVLLYVFAPQVAENVPQAAPALDAYVSTVDGWRAWLDTQLASALNWLDEAALSSSQ